MNRILSCYKVLNPHVILDGGVGQGGGGWWADVVGVRLQQEIAAHLGGQVELHVRPHGRDSYDVQPYDPPHKDFDVAYVQLFDLPTHKPAAFVWSILSDYIRMENTLDQWLAAAEPDLLISLQYPLIPPKTLPWLPFGVVLPDLVSQCESHGCRAISLPWFNELNQPVAAIPKPITAMCTGKVTSSYPFRYMASSYLTNLHRDDIVVSVGRSPDDFALTDEQYQLRLRTSRYFISGGIYDFQIPPKYFEVCNYGACLVSHGMPLMESCGFIDGETYMQVGYTPGEIGRVIEDEESWRRIGIAGQRMVHKHHSMAMRAREIAEIIRAMT